MVVLTRTCVVSQRSQPEIEALSKKVRQGTIYLWEYRQPFCWGILPLFEETVGLPLSDPRKRQDLT